MPLDIDPSWKGNGARRLAADFVIRNRKEQKHEEDRAVEGGDAEVPSHDRATLGFGEFVVRP
jgi:hypothetical protein